MSPVERHPSTVADYDDTRRRDRLRSTRLGYGGRRGRRLSNVLVRALVVVFAALVAGAQYWTYDVAPERYRLSRTEPALLPVAAPRTEAGWDTAVVDLAGLGGLNAQRTARALPSLREYGVVWAVRYDNTGIDTRTIADLIVRSAQMARIPNIVLVGHSMGGVVALEVARHIYTDSDRHLVAVVLDSTPVDLHAVRPESRRHGEDMLRWMGWLPGARESRALRLIVETYARRDNYVTRGDPRLGIRFDDLRDSVMEVLHDKIFSDDAASNGLIESQFRTIAAGGASGNLDTLAEEIPGTLRPAIVFIRPRDPERDEVVDVEYTHEALIEHSGGADGTLLVVLPREIGHANPRQQPDAYNAIIYQQVAPFLQLYLDEARELPARPG